MSTSSKALDAPIKVTREIRTARQCMAPIEGRGVVATWDHRLEQLTLYTASQMPHIVRNGLAECLGARRRAQVRVISPDVGGGFGYKGILLPEEVCLGWLAMRCGHPVRWIEDRREHLTAGANCREHHYRITGYADRDGTAARHRLRGDGRFRRLFVLSVLGLPRSGAGREHPARPLRFSGLSLPHLVGRHQQMPDPALSRRGADRRVLRASSSCSTPSRARPGSSRTRCACKNLVRPEQMPFDNITNKHFDSGDYPEALRRALAAIDLPAMRARQKRGEPDGRLIGVGLSIYCEQARARHVGLCRLGHSDGAGL